MWVRARESLWEVARSSGVRGVEAPLRSGGGHAADELLLRRGQAGKAGGQ